jgi:hypothetical protein
MTMTTKPARDILEHTLQAVPAVPDHADDERAEEQRRKAAARMRRYRQRRKEGRIVVTIETDIDEIRDFIDAGLIPAQAIGDRRLLGKALKTLLFRDIPDMIRRVIPESQAKE